MTQGQVREGRAGKRGEYLPADEALGADCGGPNSVTAYVTLFVAARSAASPLPARHVALRDVARGRRQRSGTRLDKDEKRAEISRGDAQLDTDNNYFYFSNFLFI